MNEANEILPSLQEFKKNKENVAVYQFDNSDCIEVKISNVLG